MFAGPYCGLLEDENFICALLCLKLPLFPVAGLPICQATAVRGAVGDFGTRGMLCSFSGLSISYRET